jgi:hypothetical protein
MDLVLAAPKDLGIIVNTGLVVKIKHTINKKEKENHLYCQIKTLTIQYTSSMMNKIKTKNKSIFKYKGFKNFKLINKLITIRRLFLFIIKVNPKTKVFLLRVI